MLICIFVPDSKCSQCRHPCKTASEEWSFARCETFFSLIADDFNGFCISSHIFSGPSATAEFILTSEEKGFFSLSVYDWDFFIPGKKILTSAAGIIDVASQCSYVYSVLIKKFFKQSDRYPSLFTAIPLTSSMSFTSTVGSILAWPWRKEVDAFLFCAPWKTICSISFGLGSFMYWILFRRSSWSFYGVDEQWLASNNSSVYVVSPSQRSRFAFLLTTKSLRASRILSRQAGRVWSW